MPDSHQISRFVLLALPIFAVLALTAALSAWLPLDRLDRGMIAAYSAPFVALIAGGLAFYYGRRPSLAAFVVALLTTVTLTLLAFY